ncbi:hypothetical protein GCM10009716_11080 [Streptomyces sodiiphilus]|uniref:Uncharacterized protein n=1 Tax=Streptomyces sodiiphilus TaxID=226217 RepID=A0ABN2NUW8_9ACTN
MEENGEAWPAAGLRIALIVVIAMTLRAVVRRAITRLTARAGRADRSGGSRCGLRVNAERRRQRSAAGSGGGRPGNR